MVAATGQRIADDFVRGFVRGSGGDDEVTVAQVAGDVVGALIPGLGEFKALQDLYEGVKTQDPLLIFAGLGGLVPVAGAAAKGVAKAAKLGGAAARTGGAGARLAAAGGELAAAGAKASEAANRASSVASNGYKAVSAGRIALERAVQRASHHVATDPKAQKRLRGAAHRGAELAFREIMTRLQRQKAAGELPAVAARSHRSFDQARDAAFAGMGEKPNRAWQDVELVREGSRSSVVVGRHRMGEKGSEAGFRFIPPTSADPEEKGTMHLFWWARDEGGEMKFGVENTPMSEGEFESVLQAYLRKNGRKRLAQAS